MRTYAQEQGGTRWEITKRRQGSGSGGCPCGFQPLGHVRLCDSMWTVARQAPLSPGVCSDSCPLSWRCQPAISSSVIPFSSCPQSFPALAAFPASWPKDWNFSFSVSPSSEYSELISFRIDWLDLLAVQGTLKSFLQHHDLKASVLQHSLLDGPTLTSVHDYWKNYSFD